MNDKDESDLRERLLALAVQAQPERATEIAEEFLSFVKAQSCDREMRTWPRQNRLSQ